VSRKRAVIVVLGLLSATVALGAIAVALLVTIDLRPFIEWYATKSLDRRLAIGTLRIGWGNPLTVELHDLRLANAPWGSRPDMVQIESLSAEIEAWSLLGGVLRFRKLDLVKPSIILERDADGSGNWRFGAPGAPSSSGVASVPKNRTQVPTLNDFRVHDGQMGYRTSSGAVLLMDMHEATIRSGGDDQPVTLALDGAYNGAPSRLHAETQSFVALRNASMPFGIAFSFTAPSSTVEFEGTLTEPLDFDGAQGALKLEGRNLGGFLKILDAEAAADFPFSAAGTLQRTGDHWQLTDAKGKLAASAFTGTLALQEAGRGKPDDLTLALDFVQLDLHQLLAGGGKAATAGADDFANFSLRLDGRRGTNIDASIKAKRLDYGAMRLAEVAIRTAITSGQIALKQLAFAFAGGTVDASGTANAVPAGSRIAATAGFSGVDAGRVAEMLGADAGQFAGKAEGGAVLEMTGQTVREALKVSRGSAVLAMSQGNVARALLERAATDLRSFFRKGEGSAPIKCLLGIVDLRNGLGKLSPLRLQTNEAILIGGGQLDLLRDRLDLTIKAEPSSTGFLALDVPFRVSGDFTALSVQPAIGVSTAWLDASARNNSARELPPNLQQLAERNPCLR
jgi:AsmA family protein